jgi:LysR family transcriptional regulator for metE and metH
VTRPLTEKGLTRQLYAATRSDEVSKPYMIDLIRLAKEESAKLQNA